MIHKKAGFAYQLVRSRRKTLAVIIRDQQVIVRTPLRLSQRKIDSFLYERREWIYRKLEDKREQIPTMPSEWSDGSRFLWRGRTMHIVIDAGTRSIQQFDNELRVPSACTEPAKAERKIKSWMKKQAAGVFSEEVAYWQQRIGVKPSDLRVRNMRSQWGSCSRDHKLSFNLRLLALPPVLLTYVVIHELCHIVEANHSAKFWVQVARYDPEWKQHRKDLRKYGIR